MNVQPYLFFEGRCEEALDFYTKALGTKVDMLMRMQRGAGASATGDDAAGQREQGDACVVSRRRHGGDGFRRRCSGQPKFDGFSLSITAADEADARRKFNAMAAGGEVTMPLGKTFWSPCFGMLKDPFGVGWMITVAPEGPA